MIINADVVQVTEYRIYNEILHQLLDQVLLDSMRYRLIIFSSSLLSILSFGGQEFEPTIL
jgi:hypothetical protein